MPELFRRCLSALLTLGFVASTNAMADEPASKIQASVEHDFPTAKGWRPLFNGKDLSGWKFRNPRAKKIWMVCDDVRLAPADDARLAPVGQGGAALAALLCGDDGRGSDIMTEESFTDYQLHLEFTVPKGSNSGVYNRGLFEIQVFDSFGKPKLGFHDCGSLYERAFPRENLSKPPGQWQTYDITLKGKKLTLFWNGKPVYEDQDVRYGETDRDAFNRLNGENAAKPAELQVKLREENGRYIGYFGEGGTRSGLDGADRPGPILLQGDHGPVAYRNMLIRTLPSSK
jgi:3-keto-disaccharide hydrolase